MRDVKTQAETQAQSAGRLGGSAISDAKRAAARRNGALGGRPPKYDKQTPPTFSYPGGKARLAKLLVSMMPRSGRRYVEPFAGRGNVFWIAASELNFREWHINDIRTAPWFAAIRTEGHNLIVPQNSRMEYLERWAAYRQGCPYATMLEPYLTYSGAGFGNGGYRSNEKGGAQARGFRQAVRMAHHIMHAVDPLVTAADYKRTMDGLGADDFVYLDPPYLDSRVTAYSPDDLDHTEMVSLLLTAKCRWMLSEYDQPIYREAFGAPVLKRPATTRHGKARHECVWTSADFQGAAFHRLR